MGMYDNVSVEVRCDVCGTIVDDFQSKDGCRCLDVLNFWEVNNFYGSCPTCGKWIELTLKKDVAKRLQDAFESLRKEITLDDYEKRER